MKFRIGKYALACVLVAAALPLSAGFRHFEKKPDTSRDDAVEISQLADQLKAIEADFMSAANLAKNAPYARIESRLTAAWQALRERSDRCAQLSGCDIQAFLATYQRLSAAQQGLLAHSRLPEGTQSSMNPPQAPPPSYPSVADSARLLQGTDLAEMIRLNPRVRAGITDWLTWMRPNLIETYKNYAFMRHRMYPHYERAELPEALLFGILAKESIGRVHAYSRSGAAGPMQFMPATARRMGIPVSSDFDNRLDPAEAARASVFFINEQLGRFNKSLELSLAAYNGGEGRVGRLNSAHGRGGFWSSDFFDRLPAETQDYVPKVLAAAYLFLHPEEFNLKFPELDAAPAQLVLKRAASLTELAICLGQGDREEGWFRTLRNLNPRLKPDQRVRAGEVVQIPRVVLPEYALHCEDDRFMARIASLRDARYPPTAPYRSYQVKSGDSLAGISRQFDCRDAREIAAVNALEPPRYALQVGQQIKVPVCAGGTGARGIAGP